MASAPKAVIEEGSAILHPLVVINISDHYSRSVAQHIHRTAATTSAAGNALDVPTLTSADGKEIRVIGLLLGIQAGRIIEVCHSFELLAQLDERTHRVSVDHAFMISRMEQYKQIFGQYSVVGWYSTGSRVSGEDVRLHKEIFSTLNESPIYMMVDPIACKSPQATYASTMTGSVRRNADGSTFDSTIVAEEPHVDAADGGTIVLYETELKMVNNQPKTLFTAIPYRLASADSERIALDHVSRHAVGDGLESGSAVINQHLEDLHRSVKMLCKRLLVVHKFLTATLNGEIRKDHALLRRVSALCAWLPALQADAFAQALDSERQDSTIINYLAGVTKSLCSLHDLIEKHRIAVNRETREGLGSIRRQSSARGKFVT